MFLLNWLSARVEMDRGKKAVGETSTSRNGTEIFCPLFFLFHDKKAFAELQKMSFYFIEKSPFGLDKFLIFSPSFPHFPDSEG